MPIDKNTLGCRCLRATALCCLATPQQLLQLFLKKLMTRLPPPNLKGVFVGSGSDGMLDPRMAKIILELTGKAAFNVTVVYLGTATYDLPTFQNVRHNALPTWGAQ
jgi:hypothetical protein